MSVPMVTMLLLWFPDNSELVQVIITCSVNVSTPRFHEGQTLRMLRWLNVRIAKLFGSEKKTLRSNWNLNFGLLNASQLLLPMSCWSSVIAWSSYRWYLSIDTVRFLGRISLVYRLYSVYIVSATILSTIGGSRPGQARALPWWNSGQLLLTTILCCGMMGQSPPTVKDNRPV